MQTRLTMAVLVGLGMLQPVSPTGIAPVTLATAPLAAPAKPAARVEGARLMTAIAELPSRRSARADKEHLEGLYETQEFITRRLKELGFTPELLEVDFIGSTHEKSRPLYNIVADIPGSATVAPGAAREVVLVGAHFDAVPGSPGADDNATGVAALLEMARVLKDEPLSRTIRLCFFNLEEQGMVGSSIYAADVRERIEKGEERIVLMLSLDMLGHYRTERGSQRTFIPEATGFKSPKEGDFIAVVTTLKHRPRCQSLVKQMREACPEAKIVPVDFLPALTELLRSDHAPFLGMGIPAMLVTDTADYRNPHYHKPTDSLETLDLERFSYTVKALVGAVAEAAGATGK